MYKAPIIIAALLACQPAKALQRTHPESWYQNAHCTGQKEYVLPDKTRVDCLTETHAIEYDFADKWAEAIGQSLYYASQTGKQPGIVIIIENDTDWRFLPRLYEGVIKSGGIVRVWILRE